MYLTNIELRHNFVFKLKSKFNLKNGKASFAAASPVLSWLMAFSRIIYFES